MKQSRFERINNRLFANLFMIIAVASFITGLYGATWHFGTCLLSGFVSAVMFNENKSKSHV